MQHIVDNVAKKTTTGRLSRNKFFPVSGNGPIEKLQTAGKQMCPSVVRVEKVLDKKKSVIQPIHRTGAILMWI